MKYDVNGWKILKREFENDSEIEIFLERVLGGDVDAKTLADGEYLFDYEEIAAVMDCLDLPLECRVELLTEIISERSKSKGLAGISGFRQLLCAIFSTKKQKISCLEIENLRSEGVSGKKLSDFIKNTARNTVKLAVPPQACALKIADEVSAGDLALPCGSLVVIDAVNPPASDELTLFQRTDLSFGLAVLNGIALENLLWCAPVLRLHIIPLENSGS